MPFPGSLVLAFVLLDVALILVAARIVGGLAVRVGQPRVVGEIVAGVLLGPTLLGPEFFTWDWSPTFLHCEWALKAANSSNQENVSQCLFPPQARPVLGILGQIALVFFMFLVGLEMDWSLLKGKLVGIAAVAVGVVAIPIGLAFAIAPALFNNKFVAGFDTDKEPTQLAFTLFVAAMLSVTAFPVMARILQEKGLTTSLMGAVGIASAAVVTVLMFLVVVLAGGVARDESNGDIALKFLWVGIFLGVLVLVVRPLLAPLGRMYEKQGLTSEIFAAIIILLFAASYVAHRLEVTVIVGAFMVGAILPARTGLFRDLSARLTDLTGVILLPIFLAFSGLQTDFTKLRFSMAVGIALFLVAGIAGKWVGGAVAARAGGLSWSEGNILGILMNCRGLLVLVVGLIAFDAGVISAPMQVAGVLMALITTAMTGPLFDRFSAPAAGGGKPGSSAPKPGVSTA